MQKEWASCVQGNPKNFGVKIKSHENTQSHLDASIAFWRWKSGSTPWSRPRTGIRDRSDLLEKVFASDNKHHHATRHDEPGIARAPRTRGRWRLPWWQLPRARGDARERERERERERNRERESERERERERGREREYMLRYKSVNAVNEITQHAISFTLFVTLVIFGTPLHDL